MVWLKSAGTNFQNNASSQGKNLLSFYFLLVLVTTYVNLLFVSFIIYLFICAILQSSEAIEYK